MSSFREGSPDSALMIVGMAPGHEELEHDSPFLGPAGKLLWSMLKRANIDRADCYILNSIGEWPEGKTGAPTPDQFDRWWDQFDSNVGEFSGRVALLLGGDAFWRFTGLSGGITSWGGYLVHPDERLPLPRTRTATIPYKTNTKKHRKGDPRTVKVHETVPPPAFKGIIIPALHPAGVLRTGLATAPILNAQVQKAARALRGELRPYRTQWSTAATILAPSEEIAVDIETGGINNGITRIGFANEVQAFSIPWSGTARGVAAAICARPEQSLLFHNGGFDIPRLEAAGVPVGGRVVDTMLAAAFLQPDLPKGLNACGSLYLDVPRWKHLDESNPAMYNALDVVRDHELWQVEKALLKETGQYELFTRTIMGGLPTLIRMGTTGIGISPVRRDAWTAELREQSGRLLADWSNCSGGTNPNSSHQLKQLFARLGMVVPFNKDGGESADQLAIARLRTDYPEHAPLLDLLQSCKRTLKDLETYANVDVGGDSRVHPSYVPAYKDEDGLGKGIAGTWRITAKEPNLQNQPTRARLMYCPGDGLCFVGADYAQLEARILAGLSGDTVLMADCDAGIHARNAERLGVTKTLAKNGFYGWGYLAGARTLQNTFAAKGITISQRDCDSLLAGFDRTYNIAASYRHQQLAIAQAQRYVQNPFGLRRYFPHQKFPAPAAMSTLIQSTGAIMMWHILPELERAAESFDGKLLLTVHDDVMLEVPLEHQSEALHAVKDIMEQEFPQVAPGFKVPVTPKTSAISWGEMEDVAL